MYLLKILLIMMVMIMLSILAGADDYGNKNPTTDTNRQNTRSEALNQNPNPTGTFGTQNQSNTWHNNSAMTHTQDTIRGVQQELSTRGYQVNVDGVYGPETQKALRSFQEQNGLQTSGSITQETLSSLNVPTGDRSPASVNDPNTTGINQNQDRTGITDDQERTGITDDQERTGITGDRERTGVSEDRNPASINEDDDDMMDDTTTDPMDTPTSPSTDPTTGTIDDTSTGTDE